MHPLPGLCPAAQALQAMLVLGPFFTWPLWELVTSSLARVPVQKIKDSLRGPCVPFSEPVSWPQPKGVQAASCCLGNGWPIASDLLASCSREVSSASPPSLPRGDLRGAAGKGMSQGWGWGPSGRESDS